MRKNLQILVGAGVVGAILTGKLAYKLARRSTANIEVVFITGGSRGLGLALAKRFAAAGSKLALVARDEEELERARAMVLKDCANATTLLIPADVSDPTQITGAIGTAIARFGRIDVLINNAGSIQVGPFENQPDDAFERAMATNLFPAVHSVRAVLPHMLERGSGSIVNISSIGGKVAFPHLLPYAASKFALTGFSEGLHAELRQRGIRVTTVCPGLMRTGSHVQAQFAGEREREYRWFAFGATTPLLSASVEYAAKKIFEAALAGQAELTITPQAWLGARATGIAPGFTQQVLSFVNEYVLPEPGSAHELRSGREARKSASKRAIKQELDYNQSAS